MVKVQVYGNLKSTSTLRVLILLEELNLKYTIDTIDTNIGENKTVEFAELQPFKKVPVVKYDERVLFESRSILRYIAKNNIDTIDLLGDVDVDTWLEVESQNFNPVVDKIINEKYIKKLKKEKCDTDILHENLRILCEILDVYNKRLSTVNFIGGDQYSIADISHIPAINYLLKCGYKELFKERPFVYKWLKRILKREPVEYVLKD